MKKYIKIIATTAVIFLFLAILLPSFIPAEMLKRKLIEQVEAATGLSLTINGEMHAHFFPTAGVSLQDVTLFDPINPTDKPLATLKALDVRIALIPLLSKDVVIKKLAMDNPTINLHVNAKGKENWVFTPIKEQAEATPNTGTKGKNPTLSNLQISGLKLSNGIVHYRNEMTGKNWDLSALDASISMDGMSDPMTVKLSGDFQEKSFSVKSTLNNPHSFLSGSETAVTLTIDSDLLQASLDGSIISHTFNGAAHVKSKSLTALQAWVDPSAKAAMQSPLAIDVRGDTRCSAQACQFNKATLKLDNLNASGNAGIDFAGRIPNINIELATDVLDLNPFLPPEAQKTSWNSMLISEAMAEPATGWSKEPMDFSVLKLFNLTANIKTKGLLVRKIKIGNAIFRAKIDKGRLSADVIDAKLYGGKGDISVVIDSNSNVVEKRANFANIDAEPFLKDAMNEDHLSGTANMQMNVIGKGRSQYDIISSLQGIGTLKFTNGAIKGINIADMVRNVQSAFKNVDRSSQKTDFAELGGSVTITNGIVKNSDLAMKAPLMRLSGAGQVDLPARTINYRLKPEVVQTLQGQGGKEKQGLGVPILITGSLDNPTYAPDVQGVVEDAIKDPQKIKDTIKDVKEQFKGENKKETLKGLRGLLKGN